MLDTHALVSLTSCHIAKATPPLASDGSGSERGWSLERKQRVLILVWCD